MLFNSIGFFVFLIAVFFIYWLLARNLIWQNILIVLASYIFYAFWDWRFLLVLGLMSMTTFYSGYYISKHYKKSNECRIICVSNIVLCLLILGVFKYFNFFSESFASLLNCLGFQVDAIVSHLLLPIGISFYSFKCISYTVDVYKEKYKPSNDIVPFFAYVSFFPQLMSGPIDRASCLLSQIEKKRSFDDSFASDGCRQMLWGFFKKVAIADNCQGIVDQIWANQSSEPAVVLIIGAVLYSFQIYCDFSGYSDIAIGTAKLFGIRLTDNFKYPYLSTCIPDFWRRWHMSLMTWLKDYVYIPLGGSRCAEWKIYVNILVVWLLSGLWHGANWTFVMWGVYHALLMIVYRLVKNKTSLIGNNRNMNRGLIILKVIFTFLLVTIGWVMFRSTSISEAITYLENSFVSSVGGNDILEQLANLRLLVLIPSIALLSIMEIKSRNMQHGLGCLECGFMRQSKLARYSFYVGLVMLIFAFSDSHSEFIYFRF